MKIPTTPYSIAIQEEIQINRTFLESEGWILKSEYPLFEEYQHSKNEDLFCNIELYGGFSIREVHWCNKTPEREFSTRNPKLTKEWHPTKNGKLTPYDVTCFSHKKVWWKCKNNHIWKAIISNRSNGNKCPYCN